MQTQNCCHPSLLVLAPELAGRDVRALHDKTGIVNTWRAPGPGQWEGGIVTSCNPLVETEALVHSLKYLKLVILRCYQGLKVIWQTSIRFAALTIGIKGPFLMNLAGLCKQEEQPFENLVLNLSWKMGAGMCWLCGSQARETTTANNI